MRLTRQKIPQKLCRVFHEEKVANVAVLDAVATKVECIIFNLEDDRLSLFPVCLLFQRSPDSRVAAVPDRQYDISHWNLELAFPAGLRVLPDKINRRSSSSGYR